jgi:Na+:H+ antiporter, NhaA family
MVMPLARVQALDHARGPTDAGLTIVQYGDYDCPHTRASNAIVHDIERSLGSPVRFVFRHFPLRHMHANAELLSRVAEAASGLGRFWEVHERLMSHRRISERDVMGDLAVAGIDVDALRRLAGSDAVIARVERDVVSGKASGVHSTPTWFFNGASWDGHYDRETLLARIDAAPAAKESQEVPQ